MARRQHVITDTNSVARVDSFDRIRRRRGTDADHTVPAEIETGHARHR